jgi:tRNA(Ile)-lysidine synthase
MEYLKENKLNYRIDKTNLESKYTRNKIRNKLIPYLEKNFNPKIKQTVFSAIGSIAQDVWFLSELAEKEYQKNRNLEIKKLIKLSSALLNRVLLEAIKEKKADLKGIESTNIQELIKIIRSTKNKRQTVSFKGLKATRIGGKLIIEKV